jgi:prophage regulatory protein
MTEKPSRTLTPPTGPRVPARLLRIRDLERYTGLSRSTLYRLIRGSDFPAPVRLTRATAAWVVAEVDRWLDRQLTADGRRMRATTANSYLGSRPAVAPEPPNRQGTPPASWPRRRTGGS